MPYAGSSCRFPSIGVLMIIVAALRQIFLHPVERNPLTGTLISLEIAVGFLQFGLFCLFIVLVRFFHMRWRQQAFGIVLGFGIAAAGYLVPFILRSEFGTNLDQMVRIGTPLSYIIGVDSLAGYISQGRTSRSSRETGILC